MKIETHQYSPWNLRICREKQRSSKNKQNKTKPTVTVKANTQRSKQKLCNFALQKHHKPSQKIMDKHVKSICSSYHKELTFLICEELLEVKKKKT